MSKKVASILCYLTFIPWLIALLAYKEKAEISKNLTQGLICAILYALPTGITQVAACVFAIMAIVKICQGEEQPELPLIGGLNWFDK